MGPPPTSHFHILADTPAGLNPINPPKTPQPSAARTMINLDGKNDASAADKEPNSSEKNDKKPETVAAAGSVGDFGLHTDQFDRRNAALKRSTAAIASRDWTDQETLLLLEGKVLLKKISSEVLKNISTNGLVLDSYYFLAYCF